MRTNCGRQMGKIETPSSTPGNEPLALALCLEFRLSRRTDRLEFRTNFEWVCRKPPPRLALVGFEDNCHPIERFLPRAAHPFREFPDVAALEHFAGFLGILLKIAVDRLDPLF